MKQVYESYGINWMWYLEVEVDEDEKEVTILNHYRVHKGDSGHPECVGRYSLKENDQRTVTGVYLEKNGSDARLLYGVTNPKHVFDYK
jgi:hypothetical protein